MQSSSTRQTLAQRIFAVLMVMMLAIGLMPKLAFAESEADTTAGTVTLTIVKGIGYDASVGGNAPVTLVNKSYKFEEGATLGELFAAAKEAGDIKDYSFQTGAGGSSYISSITLADGTVIANAADYSTYWANYKNGTYASGATDCTEGDVLADGDAFGFALETYPSLVGPSTDQWTTLASSATASSGVIGKGGTDTVTLTIVNGIGYNGPNAVANFTYSFDASTNPTLGDLFAIAKVAGDIQDYSFQTGAGGSSYISSITLADGTVIANAADYSTYWANYKNGTYASGATDCTEGDVLKNGDAFGFALETYPSLVGPSTDQWNTAKAAATLSEQIVKHEQQTDPENPVVDPTTGDDGTTTPADNTPAADESGSAMAKTGDSNIALFIGMFAMASVAVAAIVIARRRRA